MCWCALDEIKHQTMWERTKAPSSLSRGCTIWSRCSAFLFCTSFRYHSVFSWLPRCLTSRRPTWTWFFYPFFNYEYLHLSVSKIVLAVGLLCLQVRCYIARALYRIYKLRKTLNQTGSTIIRESDLNLTLANNVIGILVWGTYFIVTVSLLNIPTKILVGDHRRSRRRSRFRHEDILNNFFYGVQLMSGRLRVGDYSLSVTEFRGKVENIFTKSTQIRLPTAASWRYRTARCSPRTSRT